MSEEELKTLLSEYNRIQPRIELKKLRTRMIKGRIKRLKVGLCEL